MAEPLEVEYRRLIHQSSVQSNSGRKEREKPCAEEIEGIEVVAFSQFEQPSLLLVRG